MRNGFVETVTATTRTIIPLKCSVQHGTVRVKTQSWTRYGVASTGIKSVKNATAYGKRNDYRNRVNGTLRLIRGS